jgi:hypothetical protein
MDVLHAAQALASRAGQPSRVPRDWFRSVPERYVAEANTRGPPEGRPYPWSQQAIHEISGLNVTQWSGQKKGG